MKLYEFFGSFNLEGKKEEKLKFNEDQLSRDIIEFVRNNDNLHKKVFMPIAEKIARSPTKEIDHSIWMPLVNKGCMEFYKHQEMKENPNKVFSKEFRENLCKKLGEEYQKEILKGMYNLGK